MSNRANHNIRNRTVILSGIEGSRGNTIGHTAGFLNPLGMT